MVIYEGGAAISQARSLWRVELIRTKWHGALVGWEQPFRFPLKFKIFQFYYSQRALESVISQLDAIWELLKDWTKSWSSCFTVTVPRSSTLLLCFVRTKTPRNRRLTKRRKKEWACWPFATAKRTPSSDTSSTKSGWPTRPAKWPRRVWERSKRRRQLLTAKATWTIAVRSDFPLLFNYTHRNQFKFQTPFSWLLKRSQCPPEWSGSVLPCWTASSKG